METESNGCNVKIDHSDTHYSLALQLFLAKRGDISAHTTGCVIVWVECLSVCLSVCLCVCAVVLLCGN